MADHQPVPPTYHPAGAQPGLQPADYPGKTLGIVGLVLAIVGSVVGLIISVIAFRQSKAAGFHNGLAKAGIIVGIITTVLSVIVTIVYIVAIAALVRNGNYPG